MIIGDRLQAIRESKTMTQRDLAALTGLSQLYVSRVESGETRPTIDALERWASALQVSMHHIFFGEDQQPALPNLPNRLTSADIVARNSCDQPAEPAEKRHA